jgi:hypothetical protein
MSDPRLLPIKERYIEACYAAGLDIDPVAPFFFGKPVAEIWTGGGQHFLDLLRFVERWEPKPEAMTAEERAYQHHRQNLERWFSGLFHGQAQARSERRACASKTVQAIEDMILARLALLREPL